MNVVGSGDRLLETETIEHLRGVFVVSLYPADLVTAPYVISHQRTEQSNQIGILYHPLQGMLIRLILHMFQVDTGQIKHIDIRR